MLNSVPCPSCVSIFISPLCALLYHNSWTIPDLFPVHIPGLSNAVPHGKKNQYKKNPAEEYFPLFYKFRRNKRQVNLH